MYFNFKKWYQNHSLRRKKKDSDEGGIWTEDTVVTTDSGKGK